MKIKSSEFLKSFLFLYLFTSMGIFLHELSHHLFGVSSLMSLSRNYPITPVTDDNIYKAVFGTLAGPGTNLLLGYIGFIVYRYFSKNKVLNNIGIYLGVSNCFLILSGAVINLIVDLLSSSMGNDLEQVSAILSINILILPLVFSLLTLIPFKTFWQNSGKIAPNKLLFIITVFIAWLIGGAILMILDSLFKIRFSVI